LRHREVVKKDLKKFSYVVLIKTSFFLPSFSDFFHPSATLDAPLSKMPIYSPIYTLNTDNKKALLSFFGYSTINQAKKDFGGLKAEYLYEDFKEEYNKTIEIVNKQERKIQEEKLKAERKEQRLAKRAAKLAKGNKVLYNFVVKAKVVTHLKPVDKWVTMKQYKNGLAKGYWTSNDKTEETIATTDDVYWKAGDKLVRIQKPENTTVTEKIVRDKDGNPFTMTADGIRVYQKTVRVKTGQSKTKTTQTYSTVAAPGFRQVNMSQRRFKTYLIETIEVYSWGVLKVAYEENVPVTNQGSSVGESSMMMQAGVILTQNWLKYAEHICEKAYQETNNRCVYHQLSSFFLESTCGKPTKRINHEPMSPDAIYRFLLGFYPDLKMDAGVNSEMVALIAKQTKRNVYAFNRDEKCFFRMVNETQCNYSPIIYYMMNAHMYLIDNKEATKSVVERVNAEEKIHCDMKNKNKKEKKQQKEEQDAVVEIKYMKSFDGVTCVFGDEDGGKDVSIDGEDMEGGYFILPRWSMCKDVIKFINKTRTEPKITSSEGLVRSLAFHNRDGEIVTIACDRNYGIGDCHMMYDKVLNVANHNGVKYVNEGIGSLITKILAKKNIKRKIISEQERKAFFDQHENRCAICDLEAEIMEIDHIIPLCDGGADDISNLQPLCIDCHCQKSEEERLDGKYQKIEEIDDEINADASRFNRLVFDKIVTSYAFRSWQFVEKCDGLREGEETATIKKIDMNKCRRNLLYHSKHEFPKFSVMDEPTEFNKGDEIVVGMYYIETTNTFPFRGCGWYGHVLVNFGLEQQIISKSDIKLRLASTMSLPCDHFQTTIDTLLDTFAVEPDLQKLSVNAYIGMMGRMKASTCNIGFTLDQYEAANKICNSKAYVIHHELDTSDETQKAKLYQFVTDRKRNTESTMYPIYKQILEMEAVELYKITNLVNQSGGTVLDLNTDAVRYIQKGGISIENYYWDDAKQTPKYKWDEPNELKNETKPRLCRVFDFDEEIYIKKIWKTEHDYEGDIHDKVKSIIDSKQSIHIDGRAGCGKSFMLSLMIDYCKTNGLKYICLSPTNKGARIIDGSTIDKEYYTLRRNRSLFLAKYQSIDVVFIDEVSMMRSEFYAFFCYVQRVHPKLRFVIGGDFGQLPPVKDVWSGDYENSMALYSLCGGNRLRLTKNKRSDPQLFKICGDVDFVDIYKYPASEDTYLNIAFTHETRKKVNTQCMERFLQREISDDDDRIFLPANPRNPKTQDITLAVGMPIVAHTTYKKKSENGFMNSEMFYVQIIKGDTIIAIEKDSDREIEIKVADFHRYFYIAFCITIHTSQGATFKEHYTIYDWGHPMFCNKAKYVALSRATSIKNIQIQPSSHFYH